MSHSPRPSRRATRSRPRNLGLRAHRLAEACAERVTHAMRNVGRGLRQFVDQEPLVAGSSPDLYSIVDSDSFPCTLCDIGGKQCSNGPRRSCVGS